jgi:hypothetical protein
MAPYNPPIGHYSQLDVSEYSDDQMLTFIGKGGHRFYGLTSKLKLNYLWWDPDRKVVELWGSYGTLRHGAKEKLEGYLKKATSGPPVVHVEVVPIECSA